jgi:hypothetical protein
MSVAYEAESHDHGPDNRPNLGMSVEEVFSLKELSRRQKGPRPAGSNRTVTDNEERNEQRKPLSRNIAPV